MSSPAVVDVPKDVEAKLSLSNRLCGTEHHARCPTCGHMIDKLDLDEVMQHLEPDHAAPAMN